MKSTKAHYIRHKISLGLTILPFVLAGWIFTSWLAGSALAAESRGTLVVVDPPQTLFSIAPRLGFKIMDVITLTGLEMTTVTLRIPKGHYPHSAALLLRNSIPELVIDGSTIRVND